MNGEPTIAPGRAPGAMAFPDRAAGVPGGAASSASADAARAAEAAAPVSDARRRAAAVLAGFTLFLIFAGAEVKSRQAGLAVPDWPLSFGMVWPPMVGNVFYEHGHRTVAATVGFCTLLLTCWTLATERRRWVRRLAGGMLAAVVAQGVLGGLTVIYLLPPPVSIGHALLAQAFLCLVAWHAFALSREGRAPAAAREAPLPAADGVRRAAGWAAVAVYVQLFLGALMRHTESGLAVPFFPLSEQGGLLPEAVDAHVVVHMAHRLFAVVVLAAVALAAVRTARALPRLRRHALLMAGLVVVQVLLGATVIWTAGKDVADGVTPVVAPVPASLHVVTGAGLLAATWLLYLRARRARPARAGRAAGLGAAQVASAAGAVPGSAP